MMVTVPILETIGKEGVAWTDARLQAVKDTRNRDIINHCMAHFSLTPMLSCFYFPTK